MADQPAGPILDALGVTLDLDPNQQLTDVLVIGKVARFDRDGTILVMGSSQRTRLDCSTGTPSRCGAGVREQPTRGPGLTRRVATAGQSDDRR